jgi:hypothetical protein
MIRNTGILTVRFSSLAPSKGNKNMKVVEVRTKALTIGLSALLLIILAYSASGTSASTTPPLANAAQNDALDFTLVNATGYSIKELYIGASGTGDWTKEDEVLNGRVFKNGDSLAIKFHPKATAEKWDIMVKWSDGTGSDEWLKLKLTEITKITLHYNKEKDETTATIN